MGLDIKVYSSVASWISVNKIRGMTFNNVNSVNNLESQAIKMIGEEFKQVRALISKCVAEKESV